MKVKCVLIFFLGVFLPSIVSAQSLNYAKSLINQGQYLDAAKQLRPLADGGNAEAQYLAAMLFFEGKGVAKNDVQGVKYATLAANQGNEQAMILLVNKTEKTKAYQLAKKYTDQHPYLLKGEIGLFLAECYLSGKGIEKDETRAWELFERNSAFEELMKTQKVANGYWNYKMRQSGVDNLEDYADYLYANSKTQYMRFLSFMDDQGYLSPSYLEQKANAGSGWAMAKLAAYNYANNMIYTAKNLAQKAADAGSRYGKDLSAEYNYVPKSYTIITTTSRPKNFAIGKVTRNYSTTEVDVVYSNPGYTDWITLSPDIYLLCNGRKYQLLRSSNDLSKRIIVSNMRTYAVKLTFQAIPESSNTFTMIEPNGDMWRDVTFR